VGEDIVRCRVRWDVGAEWGGVFRWTGHLCMRERRDAETSASAGGYEGGAFGEDDDDDAVEVVKVPNKYQI